jgi:DNA-binding transcriptional ArsR family regulator
MLGHLRLHGAATASELGRVFGESSGATSYHLRQLERFGFVTAAAEQPSRRERRWQAAAESTEFDLVADDPTAREAIDVLVRRQLETLVEGVTRSSARPPAGHASGPQRTSRTTTPSSDADALHRVQAVVESALRQERVADVDDPAARLVLVHLHSYFAPGEQP